MRPVDYDATLLVQAVKGRSISSNQYTNIRIAGKPVRITDKNKDRAMEWFAEWAAPFIEADGTGPKVLVPVPSSKTTRSSSPDFRTALIANAIASVCRGIVTVAPVLRFRREVLSASSEGGTREPREIFPDLVVAGQPPAGRIILIDDVVTQGGHLIASVWRFAEHGRAVSLALCCGRTVHSQFDDPFEVPELILDTAR